MRVILASASPRRRELLKQIGWQFEVCASKVEEKMTKTLPSEIVEELSRQKAEEVYFRGKNGEPTDAPGTGEVKAGKVKGQTTLIIGADTIVSCGGKILCKPKSAEEAHSMLHLLQGRSHQVYSGVTVILETGKGTPVTHTFHEETEVVFYPMREDEISEYIATGEPFDKAGAYGIQGIFARYIREIRGDYSNVVGLPVGRLYQEVKALLCGEEE